MNDEIRTWRIEQSQGATGSTSPTDADPVAWIDPFESACLWTAAVSFAVAGLYLVLELGM